MTLPGRARIRLLLLGPSCNTAEYLPSGCLALMLRGAVPEVLSNCQRRIPACSCLGDIILAEGYALFTDFSPSGTGLNSATSCVFSHTFCSRFPSYHV